MTTPSRENPKEEEEEEEYFINNYVVLEKCGCDLVVGQIVCIFQWNQVVHVLLNSFAAHLFLH